jgi:D-lactate dehydrogenase
LRNVLSKEKKRAWAGPKWFPNVLVTSHMAFLTDHALRNIAETTLGNFAEFERTGQCVHQVRE